MMRWSWPLAMLGLLAGCACKAPANHADANVDVSGIERIQIEYRHMGWDNIEEHYTLVPRGEVFVLRSSYESRNHVQRRDSSTVPTTKVRDLVGAVESPAWTRSRGIHQLASTLKPKQFLPTGEETFFPSPKCSRSEQRILAGQSMKQRGVAATLDAFYGDGLSWTDDYPLATVQIVRRDGTRTTLHSNSQKALLLPWTLGAPQSSTSLTAKNWSIPISEALRAILPEDSYLQDRLDGIAFMVDRIRSNTATDTVRQCDALRERTGKQPR